MKLLWLDLNSSYAHSSLALPALHAQIADDTTIEWCIVSATINENTGMVVSRIHKHRPDIIAFYIRTNLSAECSVERVKKYSPNG